MRILIVPTPNSCYKIGNNCHMIDFFPYKLSKDIDHFSYLSQGKLAHEILIFSQKEREIALDAQMNQG